MLKYFGQVKIVHDLIILGIPEDPVGISVPCFSYHKNFLAFQILHHKLQTSEHPGGHLVKNKLEGKEKLADGFESKRSSDIERFSLSP